MQVYEGIGYDMIIVINLMVELDLKAYFGRQITEWNKTMVLMNDPGNLIGQLDLTKREIREVVMQTA